MPFNYVLIRGAGDLASGIACTLHRAGYPVMMTEIPEPTCVRRMVSFAEAVYEGKVSIEGVPGERTADFAGALSLIRAGKIAVLVDPAGEILKKYPPRIFIDGAMAKRNLGTRITDAPIVIAIGPGFQAGVDVHAVIETQRGKEIGKPIFSGSAMPDTGIPGNVKGYTLERLLRAPADGVFQEIKTIGDPVSPGETVATVNGEPVRTAIGGTLRGMLKSGLTVRQGLKVGDVHPEEDPSVCTAVTDKAWTVGKGILEAISFLERSHPLDLAQNNKELFAKLAEIKENRESAILFTLMAAPKSFLKPGARLLVTAGGPAFGSLGLSALDQAVILRAAPLLKRLGDETEMVEISLPEDLGGAVKAFIEPVLPEKKLVIFGSGHISVPLAEMAKVLGFRVLVVDDREEFASRERFPRADRIICRPFEELFQGGLLEGEFDRSTAVVIVTRGHRQDKACLKLVVNSPAFYIGMIGSLPKIKTTYDSLIGEGVSPDLLRQVFAPTGLDLGGQSPAEIALSILGQIVARQYGASAQPLKDTKGGKLQWTK